VPAVEELCFENGFSLTLHMWLQELPAILPALRVLRVHDCLSLGAESVALSQLRPPLTTPARTAALRLSRDDPAR
jgi:hypothetical protein